MPRLFTALEVPDDVAARLAGLRGGLPGARWIDTENYHVTLRFIGDIDDLMADEIAYELARVSRKPFDVTLDGLGSFGSKFPHSVFARVRPSRALSELQGEQERVMQRLGLTPEGRKFTPHVTLARCKGASSSDVATWLALRGGFPPATFRAGRFVLYSSKASRGGGPYVVEESYDLAA